MRHLRDCICRRERRRGDANTLQITPRPLRSSPSLFRAGHESVPKGSSRLRSKPQPPTPPVSGREGRGGERHSGGGMSSRRRRRLLDGEPAGRRRRRCAGGDLAASLARGWRVALAGEGEWQQGRRRVKRHGPRSFFPEKNHDHGSQRGGGKRASCWHARRLKQRGPSSCRARETKARGARR